MKFTSLLSTTFVTLSLGVGYISAHFQTGSFNGPGFYHFLSVVTDVNGRRLALTDQGLNLPILATTFGQPNQVWNVIATTTNNVFAIGAPSSPTGLILQVTASGGNLITAVSNATWRASQSTTNGFTFVDTLTTNGTTNWGLPTTSIPANGTIAIPAPISSSPDPFNAWVPVMAI